MTNRAKMIRFKKKKLKKRKKMKKKIKMRKSRN
jgi:hypothetical protein